MKANFGGPSERARFQRDRAFHPIDQVARGANRLIARLPPQQLQYLESISRSPVYAHFSETLSGISLIKAFRQQDRFVAENEAKLDENMRAYYPLVSANRCALAC